MQNISYQRIFIVDLSFTVLLELQTPLSFIVYKHVVTIATHTVFTKFATT